MCPWVGAIDLSIALSNVVLPEPDGPTTPTNSPDVIARSTSLTTTALPYAHVRCRHSTSFVIADTPLYQARLPTQGNSGQWRRRQETPPW